LCSTALILEKTEIEGSKDNAVKATIIVKSGGAGVPRLTVTVTFDNSGLNATQATTDQNGTAIVTITLTQDFEQSTIVKVTPIVGGREYPNAAQNLRVKGRAETPGFEFLVLLGAIGIASLFASTRRKKESP